MEQVRISKVSGKTCYDAFGRQLVRIGNMNVNTGDVVWTDGRCIYGSIIQGNPANPPTFIHGEKPGIPLNTKYGLLIYTRNHRLYRWGQAKQRGLLNNSTKYSLNSKLGATRGLSDADISDEGKTWEISNTTKMYKEVTKVDWLYNGVKFSDYWNPRLHPISVLMSMRNLPSPHNTHSGEAFFRWNIGNELNTVNQVINETKITDNPIGIIMHNGAITQSISAKKYAEFAKNQVMDLLDKYQGSEFKTYISYADALLSSAWIDSKGNWCGIVSMNAHGCSYLDYYTTTALPFFNVTQWSKNSIMWAVAGRLHLIPMVRTVEFDASYKGEWFVENGSLVKPIYEVNGLGAAEDGHYLDDVDRRLCFGADFFAQYEEQRGFFEGYRTNTQSTKISNHIKLPSASKDEANFCFVPLQEDYTIKWEGRLNMGDYNTEVVQF